MSDAADLIADLQKPWSHGEHVDARGITLDEPLDLDGMQIRGFDLSGACLKGGFSARGTRFLGLAWLRGAEIHGPCDLSDAHFRIDFRGDELKTEAVVLDHCRLQGVLSLAGAQLDKLSMRQALLLANVTLENARIRQRLDMSAAEIMGGFWTAGAELNGLKDDDALVSGRIQLPD